MTTCPIKHCTKPAQPGSTATPWAGYCAQHAQQCEQICTSSDAAIVKRVWAEFKASAGGAEAARAEQMELIACAHK